MKKFITIMVFALILSISASAHAYSTNNSNRWDEGTFYPSMDNSVTDSNHHSGVVVGVIRKNAPMRDFSGSFPAQHVPYAARHNSNDWDMTPYFAH